MLNGQTDRHAEGYVRRQVGKQEQSGILAIKGAEKIIKRNKLTKLTLLLGNKKQT